MLSYQHGFHAGNFADVHKHTALCLLLKTFSQNTKLLTFMDSHSGRGQYDLSDEQSAKTGEWKDGIARLKNQTTKTDALNHYLEAVNTFDEGIYPGSPALMAHLMAPNHRGIFFELHPTEFEHLQTNMAEDKRMRLINEDAMESLINYLPGRKAEGLLLVDPSYEIKEEYQSIARLVNTAHKRWPEATKIVWYPILPEGRHEDLKDSLKGATFYELIGQKAERGMYGTGLAILNAPEEFDAAFNDAVSEMKTFLFK